MFSRAWFATIALVLATSFQVHAQQPAEPRAIRQQPAIETEPATPQIAPKMSANFERDDTVEHQDWWNKDSPAQWLAAITGAAAVLLSFWALITLRQTLRATRDAVISADNTNKIALREQRPWLLLTLSMRYNGRDRSRIVAKGSVKNIGKSPAQSVLVEVALNSANPENFGEDEIKKAVAEIIAEAQKDPREGITLMPGESHPFSVPSAVFPLAEKQIVLVGVVYKSDTFEPESAITMQGKRIGKWSDYPLARYAR